MTSNETRSRRSLRLAVLIVCGFLCSKPHLVFAQETKPTPEKRARIEAAVSKFMADTHAPGVSIAVVENGEYEWGAGFGFADLENNVPASEHTLYRLGSISKTVSAIGALELVERGELDLDAPVQKYCPAFPQKQKPITTREVMGHLGGIRHYKKEAQDDLEGGNTKHFDNPIQAGLDFFKNDPLVAEPGTHFNYSTQGYTLVGCVMEGASGAKYVDFMQRNVFVPAGMEHTQPIIALPSFHIARASIRRLNRARSRTPTFLIRATRFLAEDLYRRGMTWRISSPPS